jgi:hypothetical protein
MEDGCISREAARPKKGIAAVREGFDGTSGNVRRGFVFSADRPGES